MRIGGTLRIIFENDPNKKFLQKGPRKCSCCSLKILVRGKIQTNILGAHGYLILAIWINPINICIGNILVIYINICPKIMPLVWELWNNATSSYKNGHKEIK